MILRIDRVSLVKRLINKKIITWQKVKRLLQCFFLTHNIVVVVGLLIFFSPWIWDSCFWLSIKIIQKCIRILLSNNGWMTFEVVENILLYTLEKTAVSRDRHVSFYSFTVKVDCYWMFSPLVIFLLKYGTQQVHIVFWETVWNSYWLILDHTMVFDRYFKLGVSNGFIV